MSADDPETTVIQTLRDYYAASNKHDVSGMVSYYHEPVTFITAGDVMALATRADAARVLEPFIGRLQSMGVARTDWTESHVRQLSDTLAVAGIAIVRFAADGRELERVGWTYLLHYTKTGWKIVVLASHPASTILRLDD